MMILNPALQGNTPWQRPSKPFGDQSISTHYIDFLDRRQHKLLGDIGESPLWEEESTGDVVDLSIGSAKKIKEGNQVVSPKNTGLTTETETQIVTEAFQNLHRAVEKNVPSAFKSYLPKLPAIKITGSGPGNQKTITLTLEKPYKEPFVLPARIRLQKEITGNFHSAHDGSFSVSNLKGIDELKFDGNQNTLDTIQYDAPSQTFYVSGQEFKQKNKPIPWEAAFQLA